MLVQLVYPYLKFTFGTLYPAYKTWKSLKRKDETVRRRWMEYWVNYGAFQLFEFVSDITLAFILPFYIELKLFLILWLVVGTKLVFDSIVNRELTKWEKTIDKALTKSKKTRDEIVAVVWHEVSRCSIQILSSVVSAALVNSSDKLIDTNNNNNNNSSPSNTTPDHHPPLKPLDALQRTTRASIKPEPMSEIEEDAMEAEDTKC